MSVDIAVWLLLTTAIVLANIPWLFANRLFIFVTVPSKSILINLGEWFLYFIVIGIFGYLLEMKVMGHVKQQDWEFYAVAFFMFMIFSFPGFVYRYNLKGYLEKGSKAG